MISVVEDTLASVEAVVRTQDKQGFRLLDKPKSFYFHDKSLGDILTLILDTLLVIWRQDWTQDEQGFRLLNKLRWYFQSLSKLDVVSSR